MGSQNEYGIWVFNRYAFLEEEDPDFGGAVEVTGNKEVKDVKDKETKKDKKATGTGTTKLSKNKEGKTGMDKGPQPQLGGGLKDKARSRRLEKQHEGVEGSKGTVRMGREENKENKVETEPNDLELGVGIGDGLDDNVDEKHETRGPRKGSRTRVFRRGGSNGGFSRKREFDRISGSDKSGIKPVDKRSGGGAHNWGTVVDEFVECMDRIEGEITGGKGGEEEQGDSDAVERRSLSSDAEETRPGADDGADAAIPDEPKLLTLDQWKAMQSKTVPKFNIRKPNEGADPSKWEGLVLKKSEELVEQEEFEIEEIMWVPQRAGKQKIITDVGFHFTRLRDERRGRGIRLPKQKREESSDNNFVGIGRGDYVPRGRGGYRVSRQDRSRRPPGPNLPPSVSDTNEWPSLGC